MYIMESLDIKDNQRAVISLVGGGGKTSIMFRLAEELRTLDSKTLLTTTTAIYYPGQALYDQLYLYNDKTELTFESRNFEKCGITVIGRRVLEENKLKGIPKEWVNELFDLGLFDNIIVEADGAKRKPIKAPDKHEPVIPECTSHLIGVIGLDCYLKRIEPFWVHRPQLLASITDRNHGDIIDDDVIIKLVLSQDGLFKDCPPSAGKVLFINKVEEEDQYIVAERIGQAVLKESSGIKKVLIGNLHGSKPVRNIIERVD